MNKTNEWHNVVVAVTPNTNMRVLVTGPAELLKYMDGDLFDDNSASLASFPKEPGVYVGTVEYWFNQGYSDGYIADGESDVEYKFTNYSRADVPDDSGNPEWAEMPTSKLVAIRQLITDRYDAISAEIASRSEE